jgi:hypothetical protein
MLRAFLAAHKLAIIPGLQQLYYYVLPLQTNEKITTKQCGVAVETENIYGEAEELTEADLE